MYSIRLDSDTFVDTTLSLSGLGFDFKIEVLVQRKHTKTDIDGLQT